VTGITLRMREERGQPEEMRADVVVDASGRGSRTPSWLMHLGYPTVEEAQVITDLGYASRIYHRRAASSDWKLLVVLPAPPAGKRCGYICALEENQWIVSLAGRCHDYPPADETAFFAFARSLEVPDLWDVLQEAEPVGPIATLKQPSNRRRYYERLPHFPQGLLVLGDALCCLTALYAQGMTVAALEAKALQTWLQQGHTCSTLVSKTFQLQKTLANILAVPWLLATCEDLRFPEVRGKRYTGLSLLQWYVLQLNELTEHDPRVTASLFEVVHLLKHPAALFHPSLFFPAMRHRR